MLEGDIKGHPFKAVLSSCMRSFDCLGALQLSLRSCGWLPPASSHCCCQVQHISAQADASDNTSSSTQGNKRCKPLFLPAVRGKSAPRQMRLTSPPTSPVAMAASHHFKGDRGTPFGQSPIVRALTRDYLRGHTTPLRGHTIPQLNASSLPYPRTAAQVGHFLLLGAHTNPQLNAPLLPCSCTAAQVRHCQLLERHQHPPFTGLPSSSQTCGAHNKPQLPFSFSPTPAQKHRQAGYNSPKAAWSVTMHHINSLCSDFCHLSHVQQGLAKILHMNSADVCRSGVLPPGLGSSASRRHGSLDASQSPLRGWQFWQSAGEHALCSTVSDSPVPDAALTGAAGASAGVPDRGCDAKPHEDEPLVEQLEQTLR